MTEMPDLGGMLLTAFASVPVMIVGWVANDPGPWLFGRRHDGRTHRAVPSEQRAFVP